MRTGLFVSRWSPERRDQPVRAASVTTLSPLCRNGSRETALQPPE